MKFVAAVAVGVALGVGPGRADVLDAVNQVSAGSYSNYLFNLLYTRTGDNRGLGGAQHDLAGLNIHDAFAGFGLDTSYQAFSYSSGTYSNVVGFQRGTTRPDDLYIVGAHFDSAGTPGADDNGSGTAGMLEVARVLASRTFEASMLFVAFDREEQGLIGSQAFAQLYAASNILGMVSMDMIGYNPGGHNQALLYARPASASVTTNLAAAIDLYGNGLTSSWGGAYDASDHAPFEWLGRPATLLIEGDASSNPNYHRATDTVDTPGYIDCDYAANMTRSVVGYLAAQAAMVPEPSTLAVLLLGLAAAARARARRM